MVVQSITALEREMTGLRRQVAERDETVSEKESRILDLRRKAQELEKFKFVLEHQLREAKKELEPREADITALKEQIKVLGSISGKGMLHLHMTR